MSLRTWSCVWLVSALLMGSALVALADELEDLEMAVETLRLQGDYDGAILQARALLQATRAATGIPTYKESLARHVCETLERIRAMDPADQERMTRARLLYYEAFAAYDEKRFIDGAAAAGESYEINRKLLGDANHETVDAAFTYADLLAEIGRLRAADELYADVNAYAERELEPDHIIHELLPNNWAFVAEQLGRLDDGITMRQRALALSIANYGYDSAETGTSLNNLGSSLSDAGRLAEAEPLLVAAEDVRRGHDTPDKLLETMHNLGMAYLEMGREDEAAATYRRAFAFAEQSHEVSPASLAAARAGYAVVLMQRREYADAAAILAEVVKVRSEAYPPGDVRVARSRVELGRALARAGRFAAADEQLDAGLAVLAEVDAAGTPDLLIAHRARADRFWLAGDYEGALAELLLSADIYETARMSLGAWGSLSSLETPWFAAAACYALLDKPEQAWRAAEAGHGRILADALVNRDRAILTEAESAESMALDGAVDLARARLMGRGTGEVDFGAALQAAAAAEAARTEFNRRVGRGIVAEGGRPLSLERIQQALAADEAIVGWLQVDESFPTARAWGYVIRNSGAVAWTEPLPLATSGVSPGPARALRDALVNQGEWEDLATRVWAERIEPLLPYLQGVEGLVVVPAGDMLGWPVEVAAPAGGPRLGERFRVSYAPSAGVFAQLRGASGSGRSGPKRVLALADPPFNAAQAAGRDDEVMALRGPDTDKPASVRRGDRRRAAAYGDRKSLAALDRLRHTADEAAAVYALGAPGSVLLVGPDCNERAVRDLVQQGRLGDFGLVHIATHALIHPVAPQRSCLVLSQLDLPAPEDIPVGAAHIDGLITAEEVDRDWRLDADLVTLSGCDTGLGRLQRGEGYLGFVNAFLANGARAVLVSLWPVDDRSTSLLMQRFYDLHLGSHGKAMGKAAALTAAKAWLRNYEDPNLKTKPYADPWYWSGFVLVGNPD